jgi:hypothetical protein
LPTPGCWRAVANAHRFSAPCIRLLFRSRKRKERRPPSRAPLFEGSPAGDAIWCRFELVRTNCACATAVAAGDPDVLPLAQRHMNPHSEMDRLVCCQDCCTVMRGLWPPAPERQRRRIRAPVLSQQKVRFWSFLTCFLHKALRFLTSNRLRKRVPIPGWTITDNYRTILTPSLDCARQAV